MQGCLAEHSPVSGPSLPVQIRHRAYLIERRHRHLAQHKDNYCPVRPGRGEEARPWDTEKKRFLCKGGVSRSFASSNNSLARILKRSPSPLEQASP